MKKFFIGSFALAAVLAASIGGGQLVAQDEGKKTFGTAVDVTVVNIDVFVRDSEGRPVDGLSAEDFRIVQGGVEIPVTNFSVLQEGTLSWQSPVGGADVPVAAALPEVEPAYVLLYIDNEYIQPIQRKRMMRRVRDFVEETMPQEVRMGVASARRSLDLRQPFTDDSEAVLEALQKVGKETSGWHTRNRERQRILAEMDNYAADRDSQRFENVETNYDFLNKFTVKSMIWSYVEAESDILVDSLAAMHQAIEMIAGVKGRKAMVLMSGGMPMTPGRGLMEEFAAVFNDQTIFNEIGIVHKGENYRSLATAANGHQVRIYSLDATGLSTPDGFSAEDNLAPEARASWARQKDLQESLGYMADTTGGLAVLNTNDVAVGLGLIQDDLFNYYSLGYTVAAVAEDEDHKISIELPNHPEYTIRHRRWITEKSQATQVQDQVQSALYRDTNNNPMGLEFTSGPPVRAQGKRWQVPFDLAIPIRNLTMVRENDTWVGYVDILLSVRDERGREMAPTRREHVIIIPANGSDTPGDVLYRISLQMLFRNQRHTVSVGVTDRQSQRTSFTRTEIEIP